MLNDKAITKLAENDIFMPFVGEKRRELDNGTKAISFGLSQSGYDIRLAGEQFLIVRESMAPFSELNPKAFNEKIPVKAQLINDKDGAKFFWLPPHACGLGTSVERFSMPSNIMGIAQGKSTYARCGVILNVTPIEPGWNGFLTMNIINTTDYHVRIFANEGIAQIMLFDVGEVAQAYEGAYQNQGAKVQLAAV
jgi:dCTP deaminase